MTRPSIVAETGSWLRGYKRGAIVVVLLGALATGATLSSGALGAAAGPDARPALALPDIPSPGSALLWTPESLAPSATQARSLGDLLSLIEGLAWLGFAVAGFSILSCYAVQARQRAFEAGVRRSVGASLHALERSVVLEAAFLGVCALVIGRLLAGALIWLGRQWWPGSAASTAIHNVTPGLVLCGTLAFAALFSFRALRVQRMTDSEARPVGLRIPTWQVGAGVALLLVAVALLRPEAGTLSPQATRQGSDAAVLTIDSGIAAPGDRAAWYASVLGDLSTNGGAPPVLTSAGSLIGLGAISPVVTDCGQCFVGGIVMRWQQFSAVAHAVSPGGLASVGARLVNGRTLDAGDQHSAPLVALVNRVLADRYFENGRGIGRTIGLGTDRYTVVGIVDDTTSAAIGGATQPRETVYVSLFQRPSRQADLVVPGGAKSPEQLRATTAAVRRALGPNGSILSVARRADLEGTQHRAVLWCGAACAIMAGVVLLLALIGTVTATSVWAESMAWELALRRAVGARRRHILFMVLSRTGMIGVGGVAIGIYVYASVLGPAISASVGHVALPSPGALSWVVLPPMLLAIVVGTVPAVRLAWGSPSMLLR